MFGCSVQRRHACFVPPLVVNYLIIFVQMVLAVFKLSEITQKSIKAVMNIVTAVWQRRSGEQVQLAAAWMLAGQSASLNSRALAVRCHNNGCYNMWQ